MSVPAIASKAAAVMAMRISLTRIRVGQLGGRALAPLQQVQNMCLGRHAGFQRPRL
jgi:hypothetical protein